MVIIFLGACAGHQNLILTQQNNVLEKIALDGYFYKVKQNGYYDAIFLYKNSIVLDGGNDNIKIGMDSVDRAFLDKSFVKNTNYRSKVRYIWGLYHIEGDSITIERYVVPIFAERYQTYIEKGQIINNKQFVMTNRRYIKNGKEDAIRDTFNFRPLPVKPDSTNNFIQ